MFQRQTTPVKSSLWTNSWGFFKSSGIFVGCISAALIIAGGRFFLNVTSSTLSGWTALFFLALFAGIAIANWKSSHPFAGPLQMLGLITGCATSLGALVSLEFSHNSVSDVLLGLSGILLLPSLLGIRPSTDNDPTEKDSSVLNWSLRLDNLLKYEQTQDARSKLASLIDFIWRSPSLQGDFIPAQNEQFEALLRELEGSIKSGSNRDSLLILDQMIHCLNERNLLLAGQVDIEYRKITEHTLVSDNTSSQHKNFVNEK